MNKTQEALKMAIELLESLIRTPDDEHFKVLNTCKEALAESKSEWRGLSVDDITKLIEQLCESGKAVNWDVNFAKAIEAKLKELNHD